MSQPSKLRAAGLSGLPVTAPKAAHESWIDLLRGMAALVVFVGHARGAYFCEWSELSPADKNIFTAIIYTFSFFRREAVIVFFVLSGYLVGGGAIEKARSGTFSLRHYLCARTARIYVVLIPALLLTAACDYLSGSWDPMRNSIGNFFGNLANLQTITLPEYGTNTPLWSLSLEWWYYLVFGCAMKFYASFTTPVSATSKIATGAILAVSLCVLGWSLLLRLFPVWLSGALVKRGSSQKSVTIIIVAVMLFVGAVLLSAKVRHIHLNYAVGAASAFLLYAIKGQQIPSVLARRLFHHLASVSYSLYLMHYPLAIAFATLWASTRHTQIGLAGWFEFFGFLGCIFSICVAMYWLFERHTNAVRSHLLRLTEATKGPQPALP